MGALPPLSPKPKLEHSHVPRPPSFFQNHDHRTHDCSSSLSLGRSQNPSAKPTCLASSFKLRESPSDGSSFRLLWTVSEKHSGACHVLFLPPKQYTAQWNDCSFRLLWINPKSAMNVLPCAASSSKTSELYVYGCLCLRLPWNDSKLHSRTTCAASSSKDYDNMHHDCLLRLLQASPNTRITSTMTASSAFLGLSKLITQETMCYFFLQKRLHLSDMTVPSAFWIQIYEAISKL